MTREHPRAASVDIRAARFKSCAKALAEIVPLVGHSDPKATRLADIVSAEAGRIRQGGGGAD